ncbi:MAG: peptidylprolyl isomerase, partial [Bacteroidia bacterium]|nr:peptidylprolyl isomerase [Bacteroidia bacterium]
NDFFSYKTIPAEIDTSIHKHQFGSLAAARLGNTTNPERRSSGSQFYIVTDPDGASFLDGEYTVFGKVLAGMDIAKIIENQPKNASGLPDQRIKMYIHHVSLTPQELTDRGIVF